MVYKALKMLIRWPLFRRERPSERTWDIVAWWESRRIPYNLIVGAAGIASAIVMLITGFVTEHVVGEAIESSHLGNSRRGVWRDRVYLGHAVLGAFDPRPSRDNRCGRSISHRRRQVEALGKGQSPVLTPTRPLRRSAIGSPYIKTPFAVRCFE